MVLAMLAHTMRDLSPHSRIAVYLAILAYLVGLAYYAKVINGVGWQYAIPGADMQAHFEGAKAISEGSKWSDLAGYGVRYEGIGINTIGYFLYAQVLALMMYTLPVFGEEMNVYIVYVIQIIIMMDAMLRYDRCFRQINNSKRRLSTFFTLALCVTYAITAYQLLRDTFMMWAIAALFDYTIRLRNAREMHTRNRTAYLYTVLILLAITCVLLRFYSVIVFLPIVIYYSGHGKIGMATSLSVTVILLVGLEFINIIKQFTFVSWSFETVDIGETIRFLMFPNIVNQSTYLLDWDAYFGGYNYLSGCNVPGVYYAMAVWNVAVFPLVGISLITGNRKQRIENLLWFSILLNVAMLYSISYVNIDTRHKLFMSLPMCFLGYRGFKWLREKSVLFVGSYSIGVCIIVLSVFLIA